MHDDVKAILVTALRSGRFRQIYGDLEDGRGGFCAYGLVCYLGLEDSPHCSRDRRARPHERQPQVELLRDRQADLAGIIPIEPPAWWDAEVSPYPGEQLEVDREEICYAVAVILAAIQEDVSREQARLRAWRSVCQGAKDVSAYFQRLLAA